MGAVRNPDRPQLGRLAVDMKFPIHIHIHIHRFSVDIHGYIHGYPRIYPYPQTPNLRTSSPQFLQNTAMQKRLSRVKHDTSIPIVKKTNTH